MYREIKKKKIILENRKPYKRETQDLIDEINQADWIHSSMRLDGDDIDRSSVEKVLKGMFLVDLNVVAHGEISNLSSAIDFIKDMVEMDFNLNEKYMFKIYQKLAGGEGEKYRKHNPILRMMGYNPPHFKEVRQEMKDLFIWLNSGEDQGNPIEKAAHLHNKIIEIYPYEVFSEAMARNAAQYQLLASGLPPICWDIGEQEYYDSLNLYLRRGDLGPIYRVLEKGVFKKMEIIRQLTAGL